MLPRRQRLRVRRSQRPNAATTDTMPTPFAVDSRRRRHDAAHGGVRGCRPPLQTATHARRRAAVTIKNPATPVSNAGTRQAASAAAKDGLPAGRRACRRYSVDGTTISECLSPSEW